MVTRKREITLVLKTSLLAEDAADRVFKMLAEQKGMMDRLDFVSISIKEKVSKRVTL